MSVDHKTRDAGDLRTYRTEIPNIVFAKLANGEITGEDFVLYCVLKRTAGDRGSSTKATKTLAAEAHIRVADVVAGKRRLINAGLIEVVSVERFAAGLRLGGRPQHVVTITDVWAENMALFAASAKPAEAAEQVPPVNLQVPDVELASSAGGTKEENIPPFAKAKDGRAVARKPHKAGKPADPRLAEMVNALADWQGYPVASWPQEMTGAKRLIALGYDLAVVEKVWRLLKAEDFWQEKHLSLSSVAKQIGAKLTKAQRGPVVLGER